MTFKDKQQALIEALVPAEIRAIQPYKVADATGMVKIGRDGKPLELARIDG